MAKKTRTELSTLAINTNLPDNTTELITPTTERAQLTDERESVVNYKDDLGGVPNAGKFLTVAVDGESLTMVDAPTGDVTGTGTQYQLAVWDGTSALTGYAALTYINSILQAPQLRADSTNGTVTINATDASGGTAWLYFQNASVLKAEISYFIQDDFLTIRTYQKDIVFERAVNTPTLTIDGTTGDATFSSSVTATGGYLGGGLSITTDGTASNSPSATSANIGVLSSTYAFIDLSTAAVEGGWIDFSKGDGSDYSGRIRYENSSDALQFFTNAVVTPRLTISSGGQVIVGGTSYSGVSGVDGGFEIEGNSAQFLLNNPDFNHFTIYSAADSNIYNIFGSTGNYLIGTGLKNTSSFSQKMSINGSTGAVDIVGSLSKGSGSFKIDHPLESKKDTHHLVHSFVESPQANNIYRGKVDLVNGTAQVNLDDVSTMTDGTFVLLNTDIHCYTSNETNWDAVKGNVKKNILTIECQNNESNASVNWLVIGERHDPHMLETEWTDDEGKVIVEPLKPIIESKEEEEEDEFFPSAVDGE